ncbi:MAG: DUF4846 domain-containing protein [Dongiaceae bacterium]
MRMSCAALLCLALLPMPAAAAAPMHPWRADGPAETAADRFPAPAGFARVAPAAGSFGDWLRRLPLAPAGTPVRLHDGRVKADPSGAAAVIDIDTGARDLQQCADAIIRLRAEYLFGRGDLGALAFDFTSGDRYRFRDYADGVLPAVAGRAVRWRQGPPQGTSHASLRRWLDIVFAYAGTISLAREMAPVGRLSDAAIGDALILPGSPGHAVLVLDMAVEPATGRKAVLLVQGYMPAQSLHIPANAADPDLSPWFRLADDGLAAPPWLFPADSLRRF